MMRRKVLYIGLTDVFGATSRIMMEVCGATSRVMMKVYDATSHMIMEEPVI